MDDPSPGRDVCTSTASIFRQLFNHEGYFGSSALVVQHPHILPADEGLEDFTSIGKDEGAICLFSHNYN